MASIRCKAITLCIFGLLLLGLGLALAVVGSLSRSRSRSPAPAPAGTPGAASEPPADDTTSRAVSIVGAAVGAVGILISAATACITYRDGRVTKAAEAKRLALENRKLEMEIQILKDAAAIKPQIPPPASWTEARPAVPPAPTAYGAPPPPPPATLPPPATRGLLQQSSLQPLRDTSDVSANV